MQLKLLSGYYFKEAEWFHRNYMPSFKESVDSSVMSSAAPAVFIVALAGLGKRVTKEAFDWAVNIPDMVLGCAETGRFLNDIASYKVRVQFKLYLHSFHCLKMLS